MQPKAQEAETVREVGIIVDANQVAQEKALHELDEKDTREHQWLRDEFTREVKDAKDETSRQIQHSTEEMMDAFQLCMGNNHPTTKQMWIFRRRNQIGVGGVIAVTQVDGLIRLATRVLEAAT